MVSLPNDVWIEILGQLSFLSDLHSAILSSRQILSAFRERRTALISIVLRAEIIASDEDDAYKHAELVAARLKFKPVGNVILIHEAIAPLLKDTARDSRYYKWCLRLCRLYSSRQNPIYQGKRQALLRRAYEDILSSYKPNFELAIEDTDQDDSNVFIPRVDTSRLSKYCYAVADRLADNYIHLGQRPDQLLVEQEIFKRSALKEADSLEWGNRVVKTLRAFQDDPDCQPKSIEEAVHFEKHMYEVCRQNGIIDRSLFWARHLVSEYTRAGRTDDAISEQQRILSHLRPGSNEFIAWARQLIVMHRRAGQIDEALALKAAVWNMMTVETSSYFGWARELADQYREIYRREDALRVVQQMHSQTQQALARRPRDTMTKYHARQATLALISEYGFGNRLSDAPTVCQRFCTVA
jgi:hypothetical protein